MEYFRKLERMRSRLRSAFREPPLLLGEFGPVCACWRFPHLDSLHHSWTLLCANGSSDGKLRVATGEAFSDSDEAKIQDAPLGAEDFIRCFMVMSKVEMIGDQRGGIYDGPNFASVCFDQKSGEIIERVDWIHEDTLALMITRLPESVQPLFAYKQ